VKICTHVRDTDRSTFGKSPTRPNLRFSFCFLGL